MSQVLFWDIDGTLLTTARAGVFALEDAAREVCGDEPDLSGLHTAGLTDSEVAALVIEHCGLAAEPDRLSALLRSYERHLPECLAPAPGSRIAGRGGGPGGPARAPGCELHAAHREYGGGGAREAGPLRAGGLLRGRRVLPRRRRPGDDREGGARAGQRHRRSDRYVCRDRRHAPRHPLRPGDRRAHGGGRHRHATRSTSWRRAAPWLDARAPAGARALRRAARARRRSASDRTSASTGRATDSRRRPASRSTHVRSTRRATRSAHPCR